MVAGTGLEPANVETRLPERARITLLDFVRSHFTLSTLKYCFSLVGVISIYLAIASQSLSQPAIYMDEINPDFLAVKMLTPQSQTETWTLPGNFFWDRFPLLSGSPYGGNVNAYLEFPFYYFFGGNLDSFRWSHMFVAIAIIILFFTLIAQVSRSAVVAAVAALALAVDPAFVFAFRTQGCALTYPVLLTLGGILVCYRERTSLRRFIVAGLLFGLSAWWYFVYFFTMPGLVLSVYLRNPHQASLRNRIRVSRLQWKNPAAVVGGIVLGGMLYVIAYASLANSLGGVGPFLSWLKGFVFGMNRTRKPAGAENFALLGMAELVHVAKSCWVLIKGEWIWEVMFGLWHDDAGQYLKAAAFLCLPIAAYIYLRSRSRANPDVRNAFSMSTFAAISYLICCIPFGGYLAAHHYHPVLVLAYVIAGISVAILLDSTKHKAVLFGIPAIALIVCNLIATQAVVRQLRDTGGAYYYSHVVTDYAEQEAKSTDSTPHVFMDWGGMLQFIYLTEGRIPTYDVYRITSWGHVPLRQALCQFPVTKLVFVGDNATARGTEYMKSQSMPIGSTRTFRAEQDQSAANAGHISHNRDSDHVRAENAAFEYVVIESPRVEEYCK